MGRVQRRPISFVVTGARKLAQKGQRLGAIDDKVSRQPLSSPPSCEPECCGKV